MMYSKQALIFAFISSRYFATFVGAKDPCSLHIGERDNTDSRHRRMVSVNLLPEVCERSDVVSIDIPHDGITKKFKKVKSAPRLEARRDGTMVSTKKFGYWYGEDSKDGSSFNYIQDEENNMFGSLVDITNDSVMQFHIEDGVPTVIITNSTDFSKEVGLDVPGIGARKLEGIQDGTQGDNGSETSALVAQTRSSETSLLRRGKDDFTNSRSLYDDNGGNLDIMVIWTKKAECRNSGLDVGCTLTATTEAAMQGRVHLAIEETNTAFELSGVKTKLLLVESYRHPTYVESSFGGSIDEIQRGGISGVHEDRERFGADLVAMLIDGSQYCGVAYVGPHKDYMYSVTAWNCATGYFTFGHEVGHNLGMLHDRGTENACGGGNYNYGYRDVQGRFRTILAYYCRTDECDNIPPGSCTKIQRFSNPNFTYNGSPVGTASEDGARTINESRREVAAYFPHNGSIVTRSPTPSPTMNPNGINVALGMPSGQSSTDWDGESSRAVDGNANGDYWGNSVTHTTQSSNPSWFVNLSSVYTINQIKIFNRQDCCSERLAGFHVIVWNGSKQVWKYIDSQDIPGFLTTVDVPSVVGDEVEVTIPGTGKILSLAEVEVYGESGVLPPTLAPSPLPTLVPSEMPSITKSLGPSTTPTAKPTIMPSLAPTASPSSDTGVSPSNIALSKPTSQSSTSSGGLSSRAVDGNTSGIWGDGSVTHTGADTNPFWQVDLMDTFTIDSIKIFNRQDCCSFRLSDFSVMIYSEDNEVWSETYEGVPPAETTFTVPSIKGDIVKVTLPGSSRVISLAEVEVYGERAVLPKVNVALNKPTSQSSTSSGGLSSRAVDGNTSGIWGDGSVTHTGADTNPFWQVDLMDTFTINSIKIFNRQDCCSFRLSDFSVMIYSEGNEVWSETYEGVPPAETTFTVPVLIGDLVRVTLPGSSRVISLAEVEVYGEKVIRPEVNVALNKPTSQSSTSSGGLSSRAVDGNTSGMWGDGSVTHTGADTNPFWQVNLMDTFTIDSIKIFNRQDCCNSRLSDFSVMIYNEGNEVWSEAYEGVPPAETTFTVPSIEGDVVKVTLPGSNRVISLAEVEVYGA